MRNKQIRSMTIDAMFIALIAVFSFVPNIGFIPVGITSVTTIPIIVFIGGMLLGWKRGFIYGTAFGIFSLIIASTVPAGSADAFFINPLISVFPRALWGLLVGFSAEILNKLPNKYKHFLTIIVVFFLSVIHSLLVLLMLSIFHPEYWEVFGIILGSQAMIEALIYTIIVPVVVISLQPLIKRYNLRA